MRCYGERQKGGATLGQLMPKQLYLRDPAPCNPLPPPSLEDQAAWAS